MLRFAPVFALLVLFAVPSNANALTMPDEGCGDYELHYEIEGFDPNPKIAQKEAHEQLAEDIAIISDGLDDGCIIASVVTSGYWDGFITYVLTVTIIVDCECD